VAGLEEKKDIMWLRLMGGRGEVQGYRDGWSLWEWCGEGYECSRV